MAAAEIQQQDAAVVVPAPSVAEVDACRYASWQPLLRDHTFPSVTIPLSAQFLQYLLADGITLPRGSEAVSKRAWRRTERA